MPEPPRQLKIAGAVLGRNRLIEYKSSRLVEVYREGWQSMYSEIKHLYWIVVPKGSMRGWGVHEETTDVYSCVYGEIEVALFDNRRGPSYQVNLVITMKSDQGESLIIPPGVWHTFRSISNESVLLNSKNPAWNPMNTDKKVFPLEESIPPFVWPEIQ